MASAFTVKSVCGLFAAESCDGCAAVVNNHLNRADVASKQILVVLIADSRGVAGCSA